MSKVMIEGPDVGAAGRFNIVVKNADGSVKKDYGWQSNLITQAGLDVINSLRNTDQSDKSLTIGTGSGTPSISDTVLFEYLSDWARSGSWTTISALPNDLQLKMDYIYPDGYSWGGLVFNYTFSQINNKNITELGIWNTDSKASATSYTLLTHAIIRDENGQPTAITVLTGEILQVQYELYAFIPYVTKRGTFKLKKTPDMAIPEQYTEEEYDYQLQTFRCVNSETNGHEITTTSSSITTASNYQIKIPNTATEGPVDFDKWKVEFTPTDANGNILTLSMSEMFNPANAKSALFWKNADQEYRNNNMSYYQGLKFARYDSYTRNFLVDNNGSLNNRLWSVANKYTVEGFQRTHTIVWTPFTKDGMYDTNNKWDKGLRGLFIRSSKMGFGDTGAIFDERNQTSGSNKRTTPNMLVVFSKKGTGEGIKKEWGWFLEITFGFNTVGIDLDSVKIVNASMDTSAKVLNQTHTLDLTYEEGATYNVEIQSLVENVPAEELVSVNGLTLTQVAQSGSFKVIVTVSKEGMVPRTFTQSFTIANAG